MWVISNLIYRVMSVLWLFWWLGRSLWLGYQTRQDFSCCFWWFTLLTSDSPQSLVYTEINTASSHLREKTSYSKNECFSVSKENIIFRGWTSKIPKSSQSTKCAVIISCLSDVRAGLSITRWHFVFQVDIRKPEKTPWLWLMVKIGGESEWWYDREGGRHEICLVDMPCLCHERQ